MNATLSALIERQGQQGLSEAAVIPWSCPVLSFGDISGSRVATLGLNPSNREFVDRSGKELAGANRRFHTLGSLGLATWSDAGPEHIRLVGESCRNYFSQNPYDTWFRQLDHILGETGVSYYDRAGGACHLDLIPYATACKWTELSRKQRSMLFRVAGDTLGRLLLDSSIKLLVLNGSGVIAHFQSIAEVSLDARVTLDWALRRRTQPDVPGVAYQGMVSQLLGVKLSRELLVVGFNHNIQSSFGVTREVRSSIRGWIGRLARQVLR
jgi:hypothetical protein